jgi:hypothetical protein
MMVDNGLTGRLHNLATSPQYTVERRVGLKVDLCMKAKEKTPSTTKNHRLVI